MLQTIRKAPALNDAELRARAKSTEACTPFKSCRHLYINIRRMTERNARGRGRRPGK